MSRQTRLHQWCDRQTITGAATVTFSDPNLYAIPSGKIGRVTAEFWGRESTTGVGVSCDIKSTVQNVAGTVTIPGTPTVATPTGDVSLTGMVMSLAISSSKVIVQVTGVALTTIIGSVHVWIKVDET